MTAGTFKAEAVVRIYSGVDNGCRCGCRGEYVSRGEPKFESRLKRFERLWQSYNPTPWDITDDYVNMTTSDKGDGRALTVYFD